eukprot:5432640-Karenia_brevis.AAC.1
MEAVGHYLQEVSEGQRHSQLKLMVAAERLLSRYKRLRSAKAGHVRKRGKERFQGPGVHKLVSRIINGSAPAPM